MIRSLERCVTVVLSFVIISFAVQARGEKQNAPLRNEDVVAMVKAGLSDDLVIAKIQTSQNLDFDTSTDALIRLKRSGVSNAILDAMMRPTAPRAAAGGNHRASDRPEKWKTGVRLMTKDGTFDLDSIEGVDSSTYIGVGFLLWNNYPGQHAQIRITDPNASLLVVSDKSPIGRWFLVRLDSNQKSGDRSLKMGRSNLFTSRSAGHPDSEWTTLFEAVEDYPGLWRLKPKSPLKPDEYGLWKGTGELYDFGLD